MISKKHLFKRGVIFVLFCQLLAGCTHQSADISNTLRLQMPHEPATLDLSLVEDGASFRILSALMTGLVSYDSEYRLRLELAEKMDVLEGGKRFRFKLKPWKWSDGQPVRAQDFVYAMRRTLDPTVLAKLADLLFFIKGARAYKKGLLKDFAQVGITATADDTLEFQLTRAVRFFPHVLTLSVGLPQREDIVTKFGPRWPEKMLSTGPYQISKWEHDRSIQLERNPEYPVFDPLAPTKLLFQMVPEETSALNLFGDSKLDVLAKVPAFELQNLKRKGVVREYPYFATYYIAFDQRQAPWNDRSARLAVAHAIDRKAIVSTLGEDQTPATSWIPEAIRGSNSSIGIKYDVAAAKSSWNAIEVKPANIVFGYDSGSRNQTVAEKIQSDLKLALGLKIELQQRDWKTYLSELSTKPTPIFRFGWLAPFVDAYADLMVFQSDNPNNYTGWKNKEFDVTLEHIAETDSENPLRQKLIDKAQKILLEDSVTAVPIFHYIQALVVAPRVTDLPVNGLGVIDFMRVRIKK